MLSLATIGCAGEDETCAESVCCRDGIVLSVSVRVSFGLCSMFDLESRRSYYVCGTRPLYGDFCALSLTSCMAALAIFHGGEQSEAIATSLAHECTTC
eukprot:6519367-Prymnesium_polylepis.1